MSTPLPFRMLPNSVTSQAVDEVRRAVEELRQVSVPKLFTSTEQTGSGAQQTMRHGLGKLPTGVLVSVTELPDAAAETGFDVTEGAHDSTNLYITVTNTVKYKVFAYVE